MAVACGTLGPKIGIQPAYWICVPARLDRGRARPWLALRASLRHDRVMAKLHFQYSTMNAGKSTLLLQAAHNYNERGMQTYVLTAALDNRLGEGRIGSRIGLSRPADMFVPTTDLFAMIAARVARGAVACVFIDEAQFLSREQVWQLARVVDDLHVPVMAYGLRVDFRGELFPGSAALLALADEMREVRTICHCGRKATMVVRQDAEGHVLKDGAQVQIGGNESYVSLCRRHWREAMGDGPAT
jgi:thymidine kinase